MPAIVHQYELQTETHRAAVEHASVCTHPGNGAVEVADKAFRALEHFDHVADTVELP